MKTLAVWMNGEHVANWTVGRTGKHLLTYTADWLSSPQSRPLSLSLPVTATRQIEGAAVENYFDNLLPDSDSVRRQISTRFKTKGASAFALLEAIGRDCVGAVQLLPPGLVPDGFDALKYEPLTPAQVESHVQNMGPQAGLGLQDEWHDFRLSIAGAQEKTALLRVGNAWCRPLGATPTTHILKPQIGMTQGRQFDLSQSVENEWLCNQIIQKLGLPAATSEIADFGATRVLVVTRFDRQATPAGWIARLPQEDLCQAKGVASASKYEEMGGPGMDACLEVLKNSQTPHEDGRTFLCAQLLFWLLAATDGHAKNFSLFMLRQGAYRMTPLYDVLSAWPIIGKKANQLPYQKAKMAMAVRSKNAHYKLSEIHRRHWQDLAQRSGVVGAWNAMENMAQRLGGVLSQVESDLPDGFPARVAQSIFDGTRKHLKLFHTESKK
jgi:serine/threonine-protein kinase HipA